ncbi:MAG: hypothetical protein R3Y05_02090 [bacterium]
MKYFLLIILSMFSATATLNTLSVATEEKPIITLLSAFSDDGAAEVITRGYNSIINIPEAEATLNGEHVDVVTTITYLGSGGWTEIDMPTDNVLKLGDVTGDDNYKTAMYKVNYKAMSSEVEYTIFNGLQMSINNEQKVVFLNEEVKFPSCTSSYYYRINAMQNKWIDVTTTRTITFVDEFGNQSNIETNNDSFVPTKVGKYILDFETQDTIEEDGQMIIDGSYSLSTEFYVYSERENPLYSSDGVFETTYEITNTSDTGVGMVGSSCDAMVQIEKMNGFYYVHLTQLSGQYMVGLEIKNNGKSIGNFVYQEQYVGSSLIREYVFTFDEVSITEPLDVSMYIIPMSRDVNFSLILDLENAYSTNDVYDIEEYPALFMPTISYLGQETIVRNQNANFVLPNATAKIGEEDCLIEKYVYYNDDIISISDNTINLEFIGKYTIVYKASSSSYKTSLGNNSYSYYYQNIEVIESGSSDDIEQSILYDSFTGTKLTFDSNNHSLNTLSVSVINDDNINKIAEKYGDLYNVLSISIKNNLNEDVSLDENVSVTITFKATFDTKKTSVYFYSDGNLTKVDGVLEGNLFSFNTNEIGVYIIVEESSNYNVLLVSSISVILVSVIVGIVLRRKK